MLDKRSNSISTMFPFSLKDLLFIIISEVRMGKCTKEMFILYCLVLREAVHQVCRKYSNLGAHTCFSSVDWLSGQQNK